MPKLHLMTQDDQPYGSRRKCCERCGRLIESHMSYTDNKEFFGSVIHHGLNGKKFVKCEA